MKPYLYILSLILVLAGCTDDTYMAEPQAAGQAAGAQRRVNIAVSQTDWQSEYVTQGNNGHTTRAGETLIELKDSTARTWDFTRLSVTDANALKDDETNWTYDEVNARYTNNAAISGAVRADGIELSITGGLQFSAVDLNNFHIRPNVDVQMGGTDQVLTIPDLKKGQEVTIRFASASNETARTLTPSNLSDRTGFSAATGATIQEGKGTVTADGSVTFTSAAGAINLYSIKVGRAESDGFGLYSSRLKVINSHVVWDSYIMNWAGRSNDFYLMLWPDNVIKYRVAFNGAEEHTAPGYFTVTKGASPYNTKFNGCTYQGITFSEGFELESGASVNFNSGTNGNSVKVTIVQSTSDVDTKNNQIQFDGVTLNLTGKTASGSWVCNVEEITNGRVYTIRDVEPRTDPANPHTITRADDGPGIFYVSVDIDFTAYSPYISNESLSPTPSNGITARTADDITFKPENDNRIDLMWAEDYTSEEGTVYLNFKHALGKLSIGTISNNYGETISLKGIRLTGTRYTQGVLSLNTGEWSSTVESSEAINYNESLLLALFGSLDIPDGGSLTFPSNVAYTQIPGPTITFEYTFENSAGRSLTISKALTLEKGVNKYINIILDHNHGVVLR